MGYNVFNYLTVSVQKSYAACSEVIAASALQLLLQQPPLKVLGYNVDKLPPVALC
jgi:hypothetical protein